MAIPSLFKKSNFRQINKKASFAIEWENIEQIAGSAIRNIKNASYNHYQTDSYFQVLKKKD